MTDDKLDVDALLASGWQLKDIPWITEKYINEFVEIIGAQNLKWLAISVKEEKDGKLTRGQVLISSAGMNNLKAYNKASQ